MLRRDKSRLYREADGLAEELGLLDALSTAEGLAEGLGEVLTVASGLGEGLGGGRLPLSIILIFT